MSRGGGVGLLLSSGLTPEGKGIRHLESLNGISRRSCIMVWGNVTVMGNIQKNIFYCQFGPVPPIMRHVTLLAGDRNDS